MSRALWYRTALCHVICQLIYVLLSVGRITQKSRGRIMMKFSEWLELYVLIGTDE